MNYAKTSPTIRAGKVEVSFSLKPFRSKKQIFVMQSEQV